MFNDIDANSFKSYLISKHIESEHFYEKYIKYLNFHHEKEDIISERFCLMEQILQLSSIPRDIAEISFNVYHVCFHLEFLLRTEFLNNSKHNSLEDESLIDKYFKDSFRYLFYTSLLVVTKLCGGSNYQYKVKEIIIELKLDFNTILLLEMLLLNFTEWKLYLYSPSEMSFFLLEYVKLPEIYRASIEKNIEGYFDYVLSEYSLYSSYNLSTISLAVCKLVLFNMGNRNNPYLMALNNLINDFNLYFSDVDKCCELITASLNNENEMQDDYEMADESEANNLISNNIIY